MRGARAGGPLSRDAAEPERYQGPASDAEERQAIVAGLEPWADRHPEDWRLDDAGHVTLTYRRVPVRLPLAGRHQGANAMLVLALAEVLRLDLPAIARALATVRPPGGRWEGHEGGDRVHDHDVHAGRSHQHLDDLERLLAVIGLRHQQVVELDAQLPRVLRVERVLGSGGMAFVFLAEDLKHRRPVAIKVVKPDLAAVLGSDRFLREIEI